MAIFPTFFLGNIGQENVFYDILEQKNDFLDYKDKKFKKSKNSHFLKGVNPLFWFKNGHFFNFFSLGDIGQENVFYNILEGKNASLGYEKRSLKSRKIDIFPKRLTHRFGPKMAIFQLFFLGNIGQKNVFYDILEGKNASLGYEKRKFKKSKTLHFSKGVNPRFWSNNGHISNFIFIGNIGQENVFYDILERKNAFLGYKTKKFKKSKKIDIFPKGLTLGFGIKNGMFRNFFLRKMGQENVFLRYSSKKKRLSRL